MNDQNRNGTRPLPPAPPQAISPSGSGRGALPQYIPNNVRAEKREKLRQDQFGDITSIPRLIKRDLPHHQSTAKVSIVRQNLVNKLALHDWFHKLLRWTTTFSVSILLLVWTFAIIVFALIYMYVDKINPLVECGLGGAGDPIGFNGAFAFSLETCTTVGYGLPNSTNGFFEQSCSSLQAIIYFQMVWSMMFNAFLFSFFFSRLSRSQERSVQVLFSNKAIIERKNGKWVIHIRVYDLDSSLPLVEAHARMYCVSWNEYAKQESEDLQPQLLQTMRILHPNDELESSLFTSIPSTITHHIDAYSPLTPSYFRKEANVLHGHGLVLREADNFTEGRAAMSCPVCGDSYGSYKGLKRHIEYNKKQEDAFGDDLPVEGTHRDVNIISPKKSGRQLVVDDIMNNLSDKEIIVVLEAIEPTLSGSFQALQSYKKDDIVFGGTFAPCMAQGDGNIFVDLEKFHQINRPSDLSERNYTRIGRFKDKCRLATPLD